MRGDPKIFLSYCWQDKEVVKSVAQALENQLGRENIFFDEWSIQPGDNILDRIEKGISSAQHFFLFMSGASLNSSGSARVARRKIHKHQRKG